MQGNIALAAPLSLDGSGFAGSPPAPNSVSGTNSYAGPVTLSGPATIAANAGLLALTGGINTGGNMLTIGGAGNTTISTLGVSGSGGLTVAGPGTTTLAATTSYTGTTTVTGGLLAVPGGFSINSSAVTVTGGSMIVQTAFNASTGTSTVNLNGGLLQTPAWTSGPNTIVNFNGGTLQANASSSNFLGGSPGAVRTVNINAGGAVIDTQANNIAVIQPFAGVGGLTKKGSRNAYLGRQQQLRRRHGCWRRCPAAWRAQLGTPHPGGVYPFEGNTNDDRATATMPRFRTGRRLTPPANSARRSP